MIEIYKKNNLRISKEVEKIYNKVFVEIEKNNPRSLRDFVKFAVTEKQIALKDVLTYYKTITENVFNIEENLGINLPKVGVN